LFLGLAHRKFEAIRGEIILLMLAVYKRHVADLRVLHRYSFKRKLQPGECVLDVTMLASDSDMLRDYNLEEPDDLSRGLAEAYEEDQDARIVSSLSGLVAFLDRHFDLLDSLELEGALLDCLASRYLFHYLFLIIEHVKDPECVDSALYVLATLMSFRMNHFMIAESCTEVLHNLLLEIAENPEFCQVPEKLDSLPDVSLTGLFAEHYRMRCDFFQRIRLFAMGTIENMLIHSQQLSTYAFTRSRMLDVIRFLLQDKLAGPNTDLIEVILAILTNVISDVQECLGTNNLVPIVDIVMGVATVNYEPQIRAMECLEACINRCGDIGGYLMTTPFYSMVAQSLDRGENKVVMAAMDFIDVVLRVTGRESRDCLLREMDWAKWLRIGLGNSINMLTPWLGHTSEILNHNWTLAKSFHVVGIIPRLLELAVEGPFEIRKGALSVFLNFADRLPLDAVSALVKGGLMETLADFSDELDNEQSKKIIDLLSYLLESGMQAELIKEIHDTLLESALHQAIDLMQTSDDEVLREKAEIFYEKFLDAERYLEEVRKLGL
jgi:hypothetical protein